MKKILIVEDNFLNLKLFSDVLRAFGFFVIEASDYLDVKKELFDGNYMPDLILMDIQLPVMSGIDIFNYIRSIPEFDSVKIGAISAFLNKSEKQKILEKGFDFYIEKPIDVHCFLETIFRVLN